MLRHVMGWCLESIMECHRHEEYPGRPLTMPQAKLKCLDEDAYGDEDYMFHPTTPKMEKFIEWELRKELNEDY